MSTANNQVAEITTAAAASTTERQVAILSFSRKTSAERIAPEKIANEEDVTVYAPSVIPAIAIIPSTLETFERAVLAAILPISRGVKA